MRKVTALAKKKRTVKTAKRETSVKTRTNRKNVHANRKLTSQRNAVMLKTPGARRNSSVNVKKDKGKASKPSPNQEPLRVL